MGRSIGESGADGSSQRPSEAFRTSGFVTRLIRLTQDLSTENHALLSIPLCHAVEFCGESVQPIQIYPRKMQKWVQIQFRAADSR